MNKNQATEFIQSFFDPKSDDQKLVSDKLSNILEKDDGVDYAVKLSAMLLLLNSRHNDEVLDARLEHIVSKFDDVVALIIENKLLLPEEECLIEHAIRIISEEGEAPANVSAGIDASTPRIKRKQTDNGNEYEDGDLGFDKMIER